MWGFNIYDMYNQMKFSIGFSSFLKNVHGMKDRKRLRKCAPTGPTVNKQLSNEILNGPSSPIKEDLRSVEP